nr:methylated-DNA--protein-cysteine methyltransferase isoform X2 [Equus caballus]
MPGLPALLRCSASLRSQLLAVGALGNAVPGRMDKVCDMKYKMMDSPLGKIELSGCEQGLHGIKLHGRKGADTDPVEAPAPPELLGGPEDVAEPLMQCAAWLDAYFHKPALLTELPLPALHHPVFQQDSFTRQVLWKLLKVVKFGEMISYQQLAALAGNPKAARAVGGAMRNNPLFSSPSVLKQAKSCLHHGLRRRLVWGQSPELPRSIQVFKCHECCMPTTGFKKCSVLSSGVSAPSPSEASVKPTSFAVSCGCIEWLKDSKCLACLRPKKLAGIVPRRNVLPSARDERASEASLA